MKPYVELTCENLKEISVGIYNFLNEHTDIIHTKEYGWHFIDCKKLLKIVPELVEYFKTLKLIPRHAAITIITNNQHLSKHVDQLPVIAKINIPVLNTEGWANRWYENDKLIAELLDMPTPIVFNSQITHSVEKTTATKLPRIVASFTFHNEPLDMLE